MLLRKFFSEIKYVRHNDSFLVGFRGPKFLAKSFFALLLEFVEVKLLLHITPLQSVFAH
jgi:hypothetical protein